VKEEMREHAEEKAQEDVGDMDRTKLAIPCTGQASLQAQVSPHFGHCDSYAIVTIEKGKVKAIEPTSNKEHSDCSEPVRALVSNKVNLMLVGSMGMRPYMAFKELGIEVRCGVTGTVAEAVQSYLKGETLPMSQDAMCKCHEHE
jgi:predicted Fe-Mo cluster-binding NifX family protein